MHFQKENNANNWRLGDDNERSHNLLNQLCRGKIHICKHQNQNHLDVVAEID